MINIHNSRKKALEKEFSSKYFSDIQKIIKQDIKSWETIYPKLENIYNAFNLTHFEDVKVVILGQDPYHGKWQANWLCFSVSDWIKQPPSLKNIFKELKTDMWIETPISGNLEAWAKQWILMINAILTVKDWQPASHKKIWWWTFTDNVIKTISDQKEWIIFVLWWNFAKEKEALIDTSKHYIIKSAHPSPFSARNWFFDSKPFSKINKILKEKWDKEIDWKL